MPGKTVLLTGASSGLGVETLKLLLGQIADLIVVVRNVEKMKSAAEKAYPEILKNMGVGSKPLEIYKARFVYLRQLLVI